MPTKTKPEPGYTYEVTYGAKSPQPGFTETVGDVRLAELYEEETDFTVSASYKVETPAEAALAPKTEAGQDEQEG